MNSIQNFTKEAMRLLIDLLDPLSLRTLGLRFSHLIADSFADTQGRGYPLRLPKNAVSGDRARP
jgi:hypothetical protein